MIKVSNLSYSFPQKELYNNISFTLEDGQHCAFIGTNGTGKSTLVDMIMDTDKYMYDGKLEIEPNYRIGYVSQFSQLEKTSEITVFEYIAHEFLVLQNQIATICTEMETSTNIDSLMENYQKTFDSFEAIGGDDYETRIAKQLSLADLDKHENLPIAKLSGGEFKLVQVIKEMLTSPDLIIMDEPDVFLDFENLNALKNLINYHKGMLLIITHNRFLLNHCFNKILHLENTDLQEFDGSYIDYNFSLLQSKIELQELAVADTLEIERNKIIIDKLRFTAMKFTESANGKALNARVKIQERLEARRIKEPFLAIKQAEISFNKPASIEAATILEVDDYSVSFDDKLLDHVSFEIQATDKVAIIGPNGTGKTTLLRDIFENSNDSIKINKDCEMAFLSQQQGEMLNESNTIQEEFFELGFQTRQEIADHILKYGFEEEYLNQKIDSLSGGEKNMLQLAKISLSHANLLLLDEPTSHLDTYSQISLEKAIADYSGAIIMISHDFYSVVNSMDFVLLIEDKTIRKMSMKKFKRMIYAKHFDRNYMELEQSKKDIETKIELALKSSDFELAKVLAEDLEKIIKLL